MAVVGGPFCLPQEILKEKALLKTYLYIIKTCFRVLGNRTFECCRRLWMYIALFHAKMQIMSNPIQVTREDVKRLAVYKQGLHQRPKTNTQADLKRIIERIGLLQLDSISIVARSRRPARPSPSHNFNSSRPPAIHDRADKTACGRLCSVYLLRFSQYMPRFLSTVWRRPRLRLTQKFQLDAPFFKLGSKNAPIPVSGIHNRSVFLRIFLETPRHRHPFSVI